MNNLGKRDGSNLQFFTGYQQIFEKFQYKIGAFLDQLLAAFSQLNNATLKNFLESIKHQIQTESDKLLEKIKNLIEKYFNLQLKTNGVLNTITNEVNFFTANVSAKLNEIGQSL